MGKTKSNTPDNEASTLPEAAPEKPAKKSWEVKRELKVTKPIMKGADVKNLQNALIARGFNCGIGGANGEYGKDTALAVRHFQSMNRLIVDGKAGKFTVTALGGVWKG